MKALKLLVLLFLFLGSCASSAGGASHSPKVLVKSLKGTFPVQVEIADTDSERAKGLMFRKELPDSSGMLFIWTEDHDSPFWMKNTPLSLDIIFIDKNQEVVTIASQTVPYSTDMIPSSVPYRYVLEVKSGFAVRTGLSIGDRIELGL